MEDTTVMQLCCLFSAVFRRKNGIPLDKAGDMRFKYMPPENRAEKRDAGLHSKVIETENLCVTKTSSSLISSPASWSQS